MVYRKKAPVNAELSLTTIKCCSCLGFSLLSDPLADEPIIEDCLDAFELNATFFNQQTEMSNGIELTDYRDFMRTSVDDMKTGRSFPKKLWCEDRHLSECSLM